MSALPPDQVTRFSELEVEGFTLSDAGEATRTYERDHDLSVHVVEALGGGTQEAIVLVTLGIDKYDSNVVQLDHTANYEDGARDVIRQTISTLEVILEQLEVMTSVPEARKNERNAYEIGVDAERAGLLAHRRRA